MSSDKPQDVEVSFLITGVQDQTIHVLGFTAQEAMSQLYSVNLNLATDKDHPLDLSKVIGQTACLTLSNGQGTRNFHGILSRVKVLSEKRKFLLYSATMVPRVWRLLHRIDSRIFQGKTLEDIVVSRVLKDAKIENGIRLAGAKKPPKREYCVQYKESDWNFVSRLLEEEGFFYHFEHTDSTNTLHLSNDTSSYPTFANNSFPYHPGTTAPSEESVLSFQLEERVRAGKVMLNDFNFLKPSLNQRKEPAKSADAFADLEVYDYPGLYPFPSLEEQEAGDDQVEVKDKHAKAMPDLRLQELQAGRKVGTGTSDSIRFCPGYAVTIDNLYDKKAPKEYLLTMVAHSGVKHGDLEAGATQGKLRYSNQFVCIPKSVPFRPPRITPRPVVKGPQTAIVCGPKGSEIYTDKLGRVRVTFHWDRLSKRDHTSSCWVRVS